MQQGIDPNTGLTIAGAKQAASRLAKAITTQVGSREKRRQVGGEYRKLMGLANEYNRMKAINRIHRIIANPANDLADITDPVVDIRIHGSGFRTHIYYHYNGQKEVLRL
ncbi:hypothetical protein BS333_14165 [Vibrio azureus]|uniref:Uncharacterized protein n=2 Tax=Vibrio harveyi group TaxID=717610 RepID=U3AL81_9VIBR|nr:MULTISPECIES: hypothetical protein [Vibrio harveyi group]AUI87560.1 hypothetical protein BS333_14165 [Vibrio azureus]PNQ66589.1 hypothetical protein C1141_08665 [Vibrio agarivorans]GAD74530.1 hypothetical protein VAZ01S_012_00090 [Vibrio azureus NBRC 104587]GEM75688.1 hypothetical protein VSA01S_18000 [Vibrio sagamiensis NBRC 104589]